VKSFELGARGTGATVPPVPLTGETQSEQRPCLQKEGRAEFLPLNQTVKIFTMKVT